MDNIIKNLRSKRPLVHCITNYVTVNDCANSLLAIGGSPIMADEIHEILDIVTLSDAIVINIGTLNSSTIDSMRLACKTANRLGKPIILDPVGVGASEYRKIIVKSFLKEIKFTVIRGNASEIFTLHDFSKTVGGVDAHEDDKISANNISRISNIVLEISKNTGAVVAMTGERDVIGFEDKIAIISNGVPEMENITGSGCMLTAISGAFISVVNPFDAMVASITTMGVCGERAYKATSTTGIGSMRVSLIDELSKISDETLEKDGKIEYK